MVRYSDCSLHQFQEEILCFGFGEIAKPLFYMYNFAWLILSYLQAEITTSVSRQPFTSLYKKCIICLAAAKACPTSSEACDVVV